MSNILVTIGQSKYETQISNGRHDLISDEPLPAGKDLGPSPYDLLLMALGSCIAMTLRMYADRKGWDLEGVEIRLSQNRLHAEDCEDCDSTDGFVHAITRKFQFHGKINEQQKNRLLEIAEKCPVSKTLKNEVIYR